MAADPFEGADPIWNLLHSSTVQKSLRVSALNQKKLRSTLDRYDIEFLPYRNQTPDETSDVVQELNSRGYTVEVHVPVEEPVVHAPQLTKSMAVSVAVVLVRGMSSRETARA